jgi:LPPG:FO 2-phospho-L-lactate transferase
MNDAIQETKSRYSNHPRLALLSGGVGGARAARALAAAVPDTHLTVIGNVGDDDVRYGVHVSADLDTIVYTLAGMEGPHGWGLADDTFSVMDRLAALGENTTFRLGDRDFANCLWRTIRLAEGAPLSATVTRLAETLGLSVRVAPATDDQLRTMVTVAGGLRLAFQEYFVIRQHRDEVVGLDFVGASEARPAPGVIDAIDGADVVVIAPSNPPLSVWPILAVESIRDAVAAHDRVVAVSPLFGGKPLKGPADRVLDSLGLPAGNAGVVAAYDGLLSDFVVDEGDAGDVAALGAPGLRVHSMDTRMADRDAGKRFAAALLEALGW